MRFSDDDVYEFVRSANRGHGCNGAIGIESTRRLVALVAEAVESGNRKQPPAQSLKEELAAAYAELRKQRPAIKAVFDRNVWDRAMKEDET